MKKKTVLTCTSYPNSEGLDQNRAFAVRLQNVWKAHQRTERLMGLGLRKPRMIKKPYFMASAIYILRIKIRHANMYTYTRQHAKR